MYRAQLLDMTLEDNVYTYKLQLRIYVYLPRSVERVIKHYVIAERSVEEGIEKAINKINAFRPRVFYELEKVYRGEENNEQTNIASEPSSTSKRRSKTLYIPRGRRGKKKPPSDTRDSRESE